MNTHTWLITGASSGLGAAIAKAALNAGHRVAGTARDITRLAPLVETYPEDFLPLSMDLTRPSEIDAAVAAAENWFGGLDVLVNNAALGYLAAIEEGEDAKIRTLFETNFFGAASTIRAALPGMRSRGHGTIVNISSLNGIVAMPALGYYSASKFALEGLTEALAQEVAPLGIRVAAVEPGGIRTGIVERNLRSPKIDAYTATAHANIELLTNDEDGIYAPSDPARIADILVKLVDDNKLPERLSLGSDSWMVMAAKLDAQRANHEALKEVSFSTAFS